VRVPRDGGIDDLLRVASNGRPFEAVIVESIDRLSRMTADATRIEREFERRDIGLFAADEPMNANATAILTRRVKQGVAEWYVRDLIEKSRRGMEESVRQGWHTGGRIPYGYALEEHAHPNPHKAREGKKKHRLVPDPLQAPIVLKVFEDYCLHGLGLGEICDKLNRDLDRYPPPRRNPKDEMALPQTWSRSQIQAMLRNPKYTGYNVWGRHDKRRGRPYQRPRDQWVWSATPVHEPIVPKELFDMVEERARRHEIQAKKTPADYPQRRGRRNGRFYPYRCRFEANRGGAAADAVGHPRALSIKEDAVIEALVEFMGRRLFGPDRLRLLQLDLSRAVASSWGEHDRELARLKREREEVERSLRRQTLRLEDTTTRVTRSSPQPSCGSRNWRHGARR
jgi:site-specific DNA recombinase